jgi:hypothetical protein
MRLQCDNKAIAKSHYLLDDELVQDLADHSLRLDGAAIAHASALAICAAEWRLYQLAHDAALLFYREVECSSLLLNTIRLQSALGSLHTMLQLLFDCGVV